MVVLYWVCHVYLDQAGHSGIISRVNITEASERPFTWRDRISIEISAKQSIDTRALQSIFQ